MPKFSDPVKERQFQDWYLPRAMMLGLNQDPDDPNHHYDYRGAYDSGVEPELVSRHWSSKFKAPDHPNRFVDGVDTITGKSMSKSQLETFMGAKTAPLPADNPTPKGLLRSKKKGGKTNAKTKVKFE